MCPAGSFTLCGRRRRRPRARRRRTRRARTGTALPKCPCESAARAAHLANRIVDVVAERLAALVAVEQRRKHPRRQRRGREQQALVERVEHQLAELARGGRAFRQLRVVLDSRRLKAGGHAAVDPVGGSSTRRHCGTSAAVRTSGTCSSIGRAIGPAACRTRSARVRSRTSRSRHRARRRRAPRSGSGTAACSRPRR